MAFIRPKQTLSLCLSVSLSLCLSLYLSLSLSLIIISRRLLEAHARARLLLQRQIAAAYILQRALNKYLEHRREIIVRIDAMTRRNAAKRIQGWWRRMRVRLRWLRAYRAKCKVVHQRAVEHVKRKWLPSITAARETRCAHQSVADDSRQQSSARNIANMWSKIIAAFHRKE